MVRLRAQKYRFLTIYANCQRPHLCLRWSNLNIFARFLLLLNGETSQ